MYVKGPDNALLNLSNAGSSKSRVGWQVGQLLKAMVVSVDRQGTPTLEINGRQISAQAQGNMPLRPGQMLQLEVVRNGDLPLLKVLNAPANPQETMSRGVRESLPQQQPLTQVLNALNQLAENAKGDTGQQLRALSRQLIEQLPQPQQLQSGAGVKQAVEDSGTFLESKLRQLLSNSGSPESQAQLGRDLKSGLLRLLQAVRNLQQGQQATSTTAGRTPAATPGTPLPATPQATVAAGIPATATPPLPTPPQDEHVPQQQVQPTPPQKGVEGAQTQGSLEAARKLAAEATTLVRNAQTPSAGGHQGGTQDAAQMVAKPAFDASQHLESGLSRIQFNQLHSIQQSDTQHKPNWLLEIPIRQAEGRVDTLQLEIQRDREGDGKEKPPIWTVSLSFELHELGAIRAGLTLLGEKQVGVNLWAEQAGTADLFNRNMDTLRNSMQEAGLLVSRVGVQQGIPKTAPPHKPFSDNGLVDVQA